jgi:transcriptional regulator with XRE-family HTH domain
MHVTEQPHVDGGRLRELRQRRYLSQRDLAKASGLSPTTIANLEGGQGAVLPRTVRALARALDIDPDYLTGRVNDG